MADHTYEELKKNTVAELREIAKDLKHEAGKRYSQLNKEHLLPALCQALGIDAHEHHHVVGAFDKSTVKVKMRALMAERQAAPRGARPRQGESSAASPASVEPLGAGTRAMSPCPSPLAPRSARTRSNRPLV